MSAQGASGTSQNADSNSNASSTQDGEFAHAAEAIRQSVQDNPDLANLSHQVMLEQTPQGLRIQLVDQDGRPMFQQGSAEPMPYTKKLLAAVGGIIDSLPNRVSIGGHTAGNDAAAAGGSLGTFVGRAPSRPRPAAGAAACPRDRIYEVAGKAGSEPLLPEDPSAQRQPAALHPADARSPAGTAGHTGCKQNNLFTANMIAPATVPALQRIFCCRGPCRFRHNCAVTDQRNTRVPQFFLTPGRALPLFAGQGGTQGLRPADAVTLAQPLSEALTHSGFRRSQSIAYRPACEGCNACVSVRIVADEFATSRSQKRIARRNGDLSRAAAPAEATREQFALLRTYLDSRHSGGGMSDMGLFDYVAMVEETPVNTHIVEYRRALTAHCWPRRSAMC